MVPVLEALVALASARLTWSWYQRIARAPILPEAKPFREFRFNDQLVWLVVVLIAVSAVSFLLLNQLPGNPIITLLGPAATPQAVAQLTRQLGLDRPAWLRYFIWTIARLGYNGSTPPGWPTLKHLTALP